jgi:copper/silver efflux system protein
MWGGRVVELAETEFMVRGRGYLRGISDIEQIVLKAENGIPVLIKDVARVELAPDERRGVTELNGEGEVVSGIAVQRFGQNALSVIANIASVADFFRLVAAAATISIVSVVNGAASVEA